MRAWKPVYISLLGSTPENIMAAMKACGATDVTIRPNKNGLPWSGRGVINAQPAGGTVEAPKMVTVPIGGDLVAVQGLSAVPADTRVYWQTI
jgi:hypothetical protein